MGDLSKGSYPVFTRVSEKTTENSERLGRQARPGLEPGTSRLPVLSITAPPLVRATNSKIVVLLHDNSRPHTERVTQEKILELQRPVLPHPPYSSDLAPTDFHLFCSLQNFLKGKII